MGNVYLIVALRDWNVATFVRVWSQALVQLLAKVATVQKAQHESKRKTIMSLQFKRIVFASIFVLANLMAADARSQESDSKSAIQSEAPKPNFVIIMTDDQGYQDLGCYGSPDIKTPRIDQMAGEGMKFTSFYAQTVCGPARAGETGEKPGARNRGQAVPLVL